MSERIVSWGAKTLAPVRELAASVLRDFEDPVIEITGDNLEPVSRADWSILEPELIAGSARALTVSERSPGSRRLLYLTGPYFGGTLLGEWTAVLECSGILAAHVYAQAKADARTSFVALSIDDNPDIDSAAATVESFPWSHWTLVVASVRDADGGWVERDGAMA